MKKNVRYTSAGPVIFSVILLLSSLGIWAQGTESAIYERDTLITAAREIMETTRYCALITLNKSGHPEVRTMDPFLPEDDMVVWLGTNINSRKVGEIRNDSRVTLYYEAPNGTGYVVIQGNAHLIDDPEKLKIIDYKHDIIGSSESWTVPQVEFN